MDFSNLHENRPGLILIGKRDTLIDGHRYIELTGAAFVSALNLHCAEFLRCWDNVRGNLLDFCGKGIVHAKCSVIENYWIGEEGSSNIIGWTY